MELVRAAALPPPTEDPRPFGAYANRESRTPDRERIAERIRARFITPRAQLRPPAPAAGTSLTDTLPIDFP